jgi:hypothetical protein
MKRPLLIIAAAVLLAPAAASGANTYTVAPGGSIAAALAQATDGDTVHVQPGTYAEQPLTVSHAVRIEGEAGTVVTAATGDPSKPVFKVTHNGVTITTLAAANAAGGGAVVVSQAADLVLDAVALTRTSGPADAPVVEVDATPTSGTTRISRSLIVNATGDSGHSSPAVAGGPANSLAISDTLIVSGAGEGPALRFAGGGSNTLVRSTVAAIEGGSDAVQAQSTTAGAKQLVIDSSILSGGAGAASLRASTSNTVPGTVGDVTVTAVHATLAGAATAIAANAAAAGLLSPTGNVAVNVDRSILRGAIAKTTCGCLQANASGVTVATSDTSAADVFVSAAAKNFHLRADATVINQGGPAGGGESDRDVDGQPRVVGPASDLGADEFVNQAPIGRLATPAPTRTPAAVTLDASASTDPEAGVGGGITGYHFAFGDGTMADSATPTVTHAYAKPGVYAATVAVTDMQGLTGSPGAPAQVQVVDGIAPNARIISPRNGKKLRRRGPIRFTGSASDDSAVAAVGLTLQRIGTRKLTKIKVRVQQGIWSYKVKKSLKLKRGRYELKAYAVDTTGNVSKAARVRFALK